MGARRYSAIGYETYGSVAYSPVYDGSAARVPQRGEELRRQQKVRSKVRERERTLTRAQVEVRQAGQVAVFAVVGFLAVAAFAVMLLFGYVQLTVTNGEMTTLRSELAALREENAALTARYEKVFDLATIEAAVGDTMVRPTSEQIVYIDLSEPDTVEVFPAESVFQGPLGALQSAGEILGEFIEYFR